MSYHFLFRIIICFGSTVLFTECETGTRKEYTGKEILLKSKESMSEISSIRYKFEFAFENSSVGWAKGSVESSTSEELNASKFLMEGIFQMIPEMPTEKINYSSDGNMVWLANETSQLLALGNKDSRDLTSYTAFATLPEFYEENPFWKEISGNIELKANRIIGSSECYAVKVSWDDGTIYTWYIDMQDWLPRGMSWRGESTSWQEYDFLIYDLVTNRSFFTGELDLSINSDYAHFKSENYEDAIGVGDKSPSWQLAGNKGNQWKLEDYKGQRVVMMFWNTWCGICKRALPIIQKLNDEYDNVQFLAMNAFEIRDPMPFWENSEYTFPNLLQADDVAKMYDVPWQPAFVVLDEKGIITMNLWGAPDDFEEQIRNALTE